MKLLWSEYHREVTQLAVDIYGAEAMVFDGRPAASGIAGVEWATLRRTGTEPVLANSSGESAICGTARGLTNEAH